MKTTLEMVISMIEQEEAFLPKFAPGTSQHSLLANRIAALYTAKALLTEEYKPSREELAFALPRIDSIIHKIGKARDKYEPGSRNYNRFDPTVKIMEEGKGLVEADLHDVTI